MSGSINRPSATESYDGNTLKDDDKLNNNSANEDTVVGSIDVVVDDHVGDDYSFDGNDSTTSSLSSSNNHFVTSPSTNTLNNSNKKIAPPAIPEEHEVAMQDLDGENSDENYSDEQALKEAEDVLNSDGWDLGHLESFNLLSVVTNPRGGGGGSEQSQSQSANNATKITGVGSNNNNGNSNGSDYSYYTGGLDQYVSAEGITSTLNSMTSVLDSFSREYFGTSPMDPVNTNSGVMEEYEGWSGLAYQNESLASGQITSQSQANLLEEILGTDPLPDYLMDIDLKPLESWLQNCGGLGNRFVQRNKLYPLQEAITVEDVEEQEKDVNNEKEEVSLENTGDNNEENDTMSNDDSTTTDVKQTSAPSAAVKMTKEEEEEARLLSEIPDIFFSAYFDLTDPKTFETLLWNHPYSKQQQLQSQDEENDDTKDNMLKYQEDLTFYLDTIETSLLKQVRLKSHQFFHETDNFNYLKSLIADSVEEVSFLRQQLFLTSLKQSYVEKLELIPKMALQRKCLEKLLVTLEKCEDLIMCKQSISSLLTGRDYQGVVNCFESANKMLNSANQTEEEEDLTKLHAFQKVKEQLKAYEDIVVENLSTSLVELFLNWSSSSSSPSTPGNSKNNSNDDGNQSNMMENNNNSSTAAVSSFQEEQKESSTAKSLMHALYRLNKLNVVEDAYLKGLASMVRVTVKTTVTECAADALLSSQQQDSKDDGTSNNSSGNPNNDNINSHSNSNVVTAGVTSMAFPQFLNCLEILFEQILCVLRGAVRVDSFLKEEGLALQHSQSLSPASTDASNDKDHQNNHQKDDVVTVITASAAVSQASELAHKSISELLRLRKESHSLISFEEMKKLWDTCLQFTVQLEKCSHGQTKAYGLRSTLLNQVKSFMERKHNANMTSLVASLDSEKWTQCDVSKERQNALTTLCSGRAALSSTSSTFTKQQKESQQAKKQLNDAYIDDTPYKVVWSCLLLLEFLLHNVHSAAHFQTLATTCVSKIAELLRLFNSRTNQLVLGAGAIHSNARLKSINAKHLALTTQCLGLTISILPHIRAALMAQLPQKQHALLLDLDKIKREYAEHLEKVLSKFVSIITGIVEHGLARTIHKTDFDARGGVVVNSPPSSTPTKSAFSKFFNQSSNINNNTNDNSANTKTQISPQQQELQPVQQCCQFLEGTCTNVKKMYQVLISLLPPEHFRDVFLRIFVNVDQIIPTLFINADTATKKHIADKTNNGNDTSTSNNDSGGANNNNNGNNLIIFELPKTDVGKRQMCLEVESIANRLNALPGITTLDFTAVSVLEKKLDFELRPTSSPATSNVEETNKDQGSVTEEKEAAIQDSTEEEEKSATVEYTSDKDNMNGMATSNADEESST